MIGCVIPHCKLQCGIMQPILRPFWHICKDKFSLGRFMRGTLLDNVVCVILEEGDAFCLRFGYQKRAHGGSDAGGDLQERGHHRSLHFKLNWKHNSLIRHKWYWVNLHFQWRSGRWRTGPTSWRSPGRASTRAHSHSPNSKCNPPPPWHRRDAPLKRIEVGRTIFFMD